MRKKESIKKELRSWLVILGIFSIMYFTGFHRWLKTEIQKVVIAMGIIRPATDLSLEDAKEITYDFSLISATGEELQFSELKGKVVFMNFWATWCQPCIAEMPDIDELYKSIPGENIVFVMVSVDKEFSRAKKLLGKKGFSFPIYQVNSQLPAEFSSRSIPTTFVISKDGKIAVRETGIASYNTKEFREYLLALAGA